MSVLKAVDSFYRTGEERPSERYKARLKVQEEHRTLSTSNQQGLCCHPVAISPGPLGSVLALDYDFVSCCSRLLKIRLHQPADVTELQNGLRDARDLCFSRGVAFMAERGNACVRFKDIEGNVRLDPNSLRSRADLERILGNYNLSLDGTVPTLRKRLSQHLDQLEAKVTKVFLQTNVLLSKPAALSAKSGQCNGGLYCFSMETGEVMTILENMTNSCKKIKKVAKFSDTLVFTDIEARQVKRYNSLTKKVDTLAGGRREGEQDGAEKSCSFVQVYGICSVADTLFTTDAAAGKVKLITGFSGTTNFLSHLGILFDSFGISCKGSTYQTITPEEVSKNVEKVNDYIKSTVRNVKETNDLKEGSATNGPQGIVYKKTEDSVELLLNGVNNLIRNITNVSPEYKDSTDWQTLLTTQEENLHAVSHFKHETFSTLQYAMEFGTTSKESLKRITKWGAKYYTHPSSYYTVPQTGMSFKDVQFMTPLLSVGLSEKDEEVMNEWLENYRPVRQRTMRTETTKDQAGALPPAAYAKPKPDVTPKVRFPDYQDDRTLPASSEVNPLVSDLSLSFISDSNIPQVKLASAADFNQVEEYESDSEVSDVDTDSDSEDLIISNPVVTRSGRQFKVWTRFDV
ncbi:hypothetical protein AWC38_SpisGene20742 [Stylophora pistillata]|uniref:Uncharacterized protein n=1 Tax=Stylophora pistillata TaxID=50429 RepID=A0A2B4RFD7_STYPI|nr:hypothetical protein AWC38_SpisGene20742 [Stylophora pistillata]